nr:MAG: polyprotein [Wheat yellow mosaic virus]
MASTSSNTYYMDGDPRWPTRDPGAPITRDVLPQRISEAWNTVIIRHMLSDGDDQDSILGRDGLPATRFNAYSGLLPTFVQSLGLPVNRLRLHAPVSAIEAPLCVDTSYAPWLYMSNGTHAYEATRLQPVRTFIAFNFANGYCYLNFFIPMSFQISGANVEAFSRFIEQLPDVLGAYPTLGNLLKTAIYLMRIFPEILDAPIPIIAKRPGVAQFHVTDNRGLPPTWFSMMCGSVSSFVTLLLHNLGNELLNGIVGSAEETGQYTNWNFEHDHWITSRFITLEDYYTTMSSALNVDYRTKGGCAALYDLFSDLGYSNMVRRTKRFPESAQGLSSFYFHLSDRAPFEAIQVFLSVLREIIHSDDYDSPYRSIRARLINLSSLPYDNPDACLTRNIFEDENKLVWNFEFYKVMTIAKNATADRETFFRSHVLPFRSFVKEASNDRYNLPSPFEITTPVKATPDEVPLVESTTESTTTNLSAWWQVAVGLFTTILAALLVFFWRCFLSAKKIKFRKKDTFPWFSYSHGGPPPSPPGGPPPGSPRDASYQQVPRTVVRDLSFDEDDDLQSVDLEEAGIRFKSLITTIERGNLQELQAVIPEHISDLNVLQSSAHGSGFYTMVSLYLSTLGDAITAFEQRNDISPATIQSLRTLELQLEARHLRFNEAGTPTHILQRSISASVGRAIIRLTQSALLASGEGFRTRMASTLQRIADERSNNLTSFDARALDMTSELFQSIEAALDSDSSDIVPLLANAEASLQVYNNFFGVNYVSTTLLALRRELILRSAEGRVGEQPTGISEESNEELVQKSMQKLDKEIELFQAQIDSQRRVAEITESSNLRENILQPINTVANIAMAGAFLRGGARSRLPGVLPQAQPHTQAFRPFTGRAHHLTTTGRVQRFLRRPGH